MQWIRRQSQQEQSEMKSEANNGETERQIISIDKTEVMTVTTDGYTPTDKLERTQHMQHRK